MHLAVLRTLSTIINVNFTFVCDIYPSVVFKKRLQSSHSTSVLLCHQFVIFKFVYNVIPKHFVTDSDFCKSDMKYMKGLNPFTQIKLCLLYKYPLINKYNPLWLYLLVERLLYCTIVHNFLKYITNSRYSSEHFCSAFLHVNLQIISNCNR